MSLLPIDQLDATDFSKVLDVRDHRAFADGHIPGSDNIPFSELSQEIETIDSSDGLILVCEKGKTAQRAHELLSNHGLGNLQTLEGGLQAWRKAEKPMVSSSYEMTPEEKIQVALGSIIVLGSLFKAFRGLSIMVGLVTIGLGLSGRVVLPTPLQSLKRLTKALLND